MEIKNQLYLKVEIFSVKNLNSRSYMRFDNPDFRVIDSDEQVMCNFIENDEKKIDNGVKFDKENDVFFKEITDNNKPQQKIILNENNLEEDIYRF